MSLATIDETVELVHINRDAAIDQFAQVLADAESSNWNIAHDAHEDITAMRLCLGSEFDCFLTEATELMASADLKPRTWSE